MKFPSTLKIAATLLLASGITAAGENFFTSVKAVAAAQPCVAGNATVAAYLHASRHASWLTDGPGTNSPGIAVRFRVTDSKQRDVLLSYAFRPQTYLHNTFHAVFAGVVTCANDKPIFEVRGLNRVQILPVKDAVVSPNN